MAADFGIDDKPLAGRGAHLVSVTGEIDLFTAPEFKARVSAPIDAGATRVVVDLGRVTAVDSSSLGVLIGAHRRLALREGELIVVAPGAPAAAARSPQAPACDNPAIVKTFETTGLDGVLTLVATLDEDAVGAGG